MLRRTRGFTLLEIMIVVSIIALITALGIPAFTRSRQRSNLRSVARVALENIKQARTLAGSGTNMQGGLGIARFGGIVVLSATSYGVMLDANTTPTDGNEVVVKVIDFRAADPGNSLTVAWSGPLAGNALYFQSNGLVFTPSPPDLVITDTQLNATQTIRLATSGTAHIIE